MSDAEDIRTRSLLEVAELDVIGHLSGASNATLACTVRDKETDSQIPCVYKPRRGERPLWDFATGSLGHREVATAVLDEILGWNLLPLTVWREDGPLGPGMCQRWIDDDTAHPAVAVVAPDELSPGWLVVLEARTYDGQQVVLAHEDSRELRRMCVLDLVANNADRKGGHVLRGPGGRVLGIDHGLTFHVQHKLRTVLWGWSGLDIDDDLLVDLDRLRLALLGSDQRVARVRSLLTPAEAAALVERTCSLLETGTFPAPEASEDPSLPWPPM